MSVTGPNEELYRALQNPTFHLERYFIDLGRLAIRLDGADSVQLITAAGKLHDEAERLAGYADEVKAGKITRRLLHKRLARRDNLNRTIAS